MNAKLAVNSAAATGVVTLLIVTVAAVAACKREVAVAPPSVPGTAAAPVPLDDGSRYPIMRKRKFGYIDRFGVERIAPAFETARSFSEGFAAVRLEKDGRFGFIDTSGKVIIAPQFEEVDNFSEGLAGVKVGERYGYIDKSGLMAIQAKFGSVSDFASDGCALVSSPTAENTFGSRRHWIDREGKQIDFESNHRCGAAARYEFLLADREDKERVAAVALQNHSDPGKVRRGLIRDKKSGKPLVLFDVFDVDDEHVLPVLQRTGRNEQLQIVVCVDGQYRLETYRSVELVSARCGLIDAFGHETVPAQFDALRYLGQGRAAIAVGPRRLKDVDFSRLAPPTRPRWMSAQTAKTYFGAPDVFEQPDFLGAFSGPISDDGRRWGVVEVPGGRQLSNPVFDRIEPYRNGLARAFFAGKYGFLGLDGNWAIQPKFVEAEDFEGDLAVVVLGTRAIYIDRSGKEIALAADEPYTPPSPAEVSATPAPPSKERFGTAFFVSPGGDAITNAHVVAGCNHVVDEKSGATATGVVVDKAADLALVRFGHSTADFLKIRSDDAAAVGERVVVYGYPLGQVLASSGVATFGNVSSLAGPDNRSDQFQMSAQVGPGSSGGPVIDPKGSVVGVVVSTLSDEKVLKATGTVPQNTNFGIKSSALSTFLASQGVKTESPRVWHFAQSDEALSKLAASATTRLRCAI